MPNPHADAAAARAGLTDSMIAMAKPGTVVYVLHGSPRDLNAIWKYGLHPVIHHDMIVHGDARRLEVLQVMARRRPFDLRIQPAIEFLKSIPQSGDVLLTSTHSAYYDSEEARNVIAAHRVRNPDFNHLAIFTRPRRVMRALHSKSEALEGCYRILDINGEPWLEQVMAGNIQSYLHQLPLWVTSTAVFSADIPGANGVTVHTPVEYGYQQLNREWDDSVLGQLYVRIVRPTAALALRENPEARLLTFDGRPIAAFAPEVACEGPVWSSLAPAYRALRRFWGETHQLRAAVSDDDVAATAMILAGFPASTQAAHKWRLVMNYLKDKYPDVPPAWVRDAAERILEAPRIARTIATQGFNPVRWLADYAWGYATSRHIAPLPASIDMQAVAAGNMEVDGTEMDVARESVNSLALAVRNMESELSSPAINRSCPLLFNRIDLDRMAKFDPEFLDSVAPTCTVEKKMVRLWSGPIGDCVEPNSYAPCVHSAMSVLLERYYAGASKLISEEGLQRVRRAGGHSTYDLCSGAKVVRTRLEVPDDWMILTGEDVFETIRPQNRQRYIEAAMKCGGIQALYEKGIRELIRDFSCEESAIKEAEELMVASGKLDAMSSLIEMGMVKDLDMFIKAECTLSPIVSGKVAKARGIMAASPAHVLVLKPAFDALSKYLKENWDGKQVTHTIVFKDGTRLEVVVVYCPGRNLMEVASIAHDRGYPTSRAVAIDLSKSEATLGGPVGHHALRYALRGLIGKEYKAKKEGLEVPANVMALFHYGRSAYLRAGIAKFRAPCEKAPVKQYKIKVPPILASGVPETSVLTTLANIETAIQALARTNLRGEATLMAFGDDTKLFHHGSRASEVGFVNSFTNAHAEIGLEPSFEHAGFVDPGECTFLNSFFVHDPDRGQCLPIQSSGRALHGLFSTATFVSDREGRLLAKLLSLRDPMRGVPYISELIEGLIDVIKTQPKEYVEEKEHHPGRGYTLPRSDHVEWWFQERYGIPVEKARQAASRLVCRYADGESLECEVMSHIMLVDGFGME